MESMNSHLEDTLQCGVCFENFTETGPLVPLILPCGHSFCLRCLSTLPDTNKEHKKLCPFCMQPFEQHVTSLPRNMSLLALISGFSSLMSQSSQPISSPTPETMPPRDPSRVPSILRRSSSSSSEHWQKNEKMDHSWSSSVLNNALWRDLPDLMTRETVRNVASDCFHPDMFVKLEQNGVITKDEFFNVVGRTDVFVSYDFDGEDTKIQEKIVAISDWLRSNGLTITLGNRMTNDKKFIATGIDNAQCVVVVITSSYIDDVAHNPESNSRLEFNYAFRRKTNNRMIPLVLEECVYNAESWEGDVGSVLRDREIIECYGDVFDHDYFKNPMKKLYDMIIDVIGEPLTGQHVTLAWFEASISEIPKKTDQKQKRVCAKGGPAEKRKALRHLSIEEVQLLLESAKLSKFKDAFVDYEVDGATLFECQSPEDLQDLGISLLPKCRAFYNRLEEYKEVGVPLRLVRGDCSRVSESSLDSTNPPSSEASVDLMPKNLNVIEVSGCQGSLALHINGTYDPLDSLQGRCVVYKKRSQEVFLEYCEARGHWQVKSGKYRGTSNAWMFVPSSSSSSSAPPDQLESCSAHVWDGEKFEVQEALKFKPCYASVMIQGCVGTVAGQVNGVFDPTEEKSGGTVLYRKRDSPGYLMEYFEEEKQWHVKPEKSKGTSNAWAYLSCSPVCHPYEVLDACWYCFEDGYFEAQHDIVAIEAPSDVCVAGCAVENVKSVINGIYSPTSEVCDGYIRYKHKSKESWLEYHLPSSSWHIIPTSSKGTSNAWAYGTYRSLRSPDRNAPIWLAFDKSNSFVEDPDLLVLRDVRPVLVAADDTAIRSELREFVSGVYIPTAETCGGWVRYVMTDSDLWLEYSKERKQWLLKPSQLKGKESAWAFVHCSEPRSPHEATSQWSFFNGKRFSKCPNVFLSVI